MSKLTVRAVHPREFVDTADLVATTFSNGDPRRYEKMLHRWISHLPTKPGFEYSHSRVGILDDTIVAHALIEHYILRYGNARLRVGGLSWICTARAYRKNGYGAKVMQDALAYMAEQGAHLALMDGSRGYYARFGFSPVWPFYQLEINSAEAAKLRAPLYLRDAEESDIPAMMALYKKHWGGRVAFTRSEALWRWRLLTDDPPPLVVADRTGDVVAYIRGRWNSDLVEVVSDTPEATQTILSAAGQWHQEAGEPMIRWQIPPEDTLIAHARDLVALILSAQYIPDGGWMARLIDTTALVDELLPELIDQALSTDPAFDGDALVLDCQPGRVRIGSRRQKNSFVELNHRDFIQVMFGSLRPESLAARVPVSQAALYLLQLLFPPRMATLGGWDWF